MTIYDTTDPYTTLRVQLESLRKGDTKTVYQLASPSNRQATAQGGYHFEVFDTMVRSSTYSPLLYFKRFKTIYKEQQSPHTYVANILITQETKSYVFRFKMSLQETKQIDTHESLTPYQLTKNHPPVWRTDSVIRLK